MADALPCLVCGRQLQRDNDMYEVQPRDGVIITSHGNDGSRVFDPVMSGDTLYMNLCDRCLIEAGERGCVRAGVDSIAITTDCPIPTKDDSYSVVSTIVGHQRIESPLVEWTRRTPNDDRQRYIAIEDLLNGGFFDHPDYSFTVNREHVEEWLQLLQEIGEA